MRVNGPAKLPAPRGTATTPGAHFLSHIPHNPSRVGARYGSLGLCQIGTLVDKLVY